MYVCEWRCTPATVHAEKFAEVRSLFPLWDPAMELKLSDLYSKCFYLLSHLSGPSLCLLIRNLAHLYCP